MSSDLRRRLHKVLTPAPLRVVRVADGRTPAVAGMCAARVTIADHSIPVLFTVLDTCPHELILGLDFLSEHAALIDCAAGVLRLELPVASASTDVAQPRFCSTEHVRLPPQAVTYVHMSACPPVPDGDYVVSPITDVLLTRRVSLPHTVVTVTSNHVHLPFLNFGFSPEALPQGISLAVLFPLSEFEVSAVNVDVPSGLAADHSTSLPKSDDFTRMIAPDLSPTHAQELSHLLASYRDIFDFGNQPLGQTTTVKHRIHTGDATPVHRRPYRVSHVERRVIQQEVNKMLSKGIIEPSSSPWASPVVLVKKKDGTWRFCVDYRHLNKITKKDVYPLPRIDDALDCLHGAKYFSSIDLRSGYWQIAVDEMDREKTAFITPDGLYQFKVMPFGLCNAPATFERMMDSLLLGFKWSTCLCYLDDVIIFLQPLKHISSAFRTSLAFSARRDFSLTQRNAISVVGSLPSLATLSMLLVSSRILTKSVRSGTFLSHFPQRTSVVLSGFVHTSDGSSRILPPSPVLSQIC